MQALAEHLPHVAARVPWVTLGDWPTPLVPLLIEGRPVWVKHEGDSHADYGGNKIRTLEVWLGHARDRSARKIWAIGAYGSNHAVATVLHARTAGLAAAALVFPQPASPWAIENAGALIASGCELVRLRSVAEVPFAALRIARRERDAIVMPPGGATPIGTMGALSAAFELADQIAAGLAPPPRRIVLAVGSTCTTAGLLAGLQLAHAVGVWRWPVPIVHGVRVTPWPVTSRVRIAALALRTLARVHALGGPRVAIGLAELTARLVIDGSELGPGYGRPTARSDAAAAIIGGRDGGGRDGGGRDRGGRDGGGRDDGGRDHGGRDHGGRDGSPLHGRAAALLGSPRLDGVYSAKAAAALLRLHRARIGPLVFWASKATARLASPSLEALREAPRALVDWLTPADGS